MRVQQETDYQFLKRSGFQEVASYRDFSFAPPVVAQATHQNFELYFGNVLPNMGPVREYFAGHTLSFVHAAEKGFLRDFRKIGKEFVSGEDLQRLLTSAKPYTNNPDLEDTEAFGYSLVVFSVLPDLAHSQYIPTGFSRQGLLEPPFTTMEFLARLRELRGEVTRIINGQTPPGTSAEARDELWRTYLFFDVAKDLPLHYLESPREIEERARNTFEHLLDNIPINLD